MSFVNYAGICIRFFTGFEDQTLLVNIALRKQNSLFVLGLHLSL